MLNRLHIFIGAVFGGLAVFLVMQAVNALWVIPAAKDAGREIERAAILKQAMENIEERSKTNAEIRNLDDAGLCLELGGVLENGICR
jgi:hypothetical protein